MRDQASQVDRKQTKMKLQKRLATGVQCTNHGTYIQIFIFVYNSTTRVWFYLWFYDSLMKKFQFLDILQYFLIEYLLQMLWWYLSVHLTFTTNRPCTLVLFAGAYNPILRKRSNKRVLIALPRPTTNDIDIYIIILAKV